MKFETSVQELKNEVLTEVAKNLYGEKGEVDLISIPERLIPGPEARARCCIYKERAIVSERVKIAMGGDESNPNMVEVLPIACDECPVSQMSVSDACRGCIAHRCQNACPVNAITLVDHKAVIDKKKCIKCGKCLNACPYGAIIKQLRPCERACPVGAISMGENEKAHIDNDKCISCGACVYQCPFGAIMDKSYMSHTIKLLTAPDTTVHAIIAPSIASQFMPATMPQVIAGIKALGFEGVFEAALGADMVALKEAEELVEKGFLTSSCCPAFVTYIKKYFPQLKDHISHNYSPMVEMGRHIKEKDPSCKVIFIGPCIAKKEEVLKGKGAGIIDYAITFEELLAMFYAQNINLEQLEGEQLDTASYFGRIFARSGGLSDAVSQALHELGISEDKFKLKGQTCSGIQECKVALLKAEKKLSDVNFIEGMACVQGCIGGPACLSHGVKDKTLIDKYGEAGGHRTIKDAVFDFKMRNK